jgi:hypothetical protein
MFDHRADDRVRRRTPAHVNARIDRQTRASVDDSAALGQDAIVARLQEIDREWDVDRALMLNFAILGSLTYELGRHRHWGWMVFFRIQQAFLGVHALVGWCPPLPVFRRLGFRTAKEIAAERALLMGRLAALRAPK